MQKQSLINKWVVYIQRELFDNSLFECAGIVKSVSDDVSSAIVWFPLHGNRNIPIGCLEIQQNVTT